MIYNNFENFYNSEAQLYWNVYVNQKSGTVLKQSWIKWFLNEILWVDENWIEIANTVHFTTWYKNADYVESDYLLINWKKYIIRTIVNKKLFDIEYTKLVLRTE